MTQGDPLAMAMFALAMVPLVDKASGEVSQIWYADDASARGWKGSEPGGTKSRHLVLNMDTFQTLPRHGWW